MRRFYQAEIIMLIGFILSIPMSADADGNETRILHKVNSPDGNCTEGIVLTTQAEVDAYPATYGCSQVLDLFILGTEITHLDSLYQITTITHSLTIWDTQLQDLHGLENLTSSGRLALRETTLSTLEGLSGLQQLAGDDSGLEVIDLQMNPNLTSLSGLTSLTAVMGGIKIVGNPTLAGIALPGISTVNGKVTISGNPMLTNLDGLQTITIINGLLDIFSNSGLVSVSGLSGLKTVSGYVSFLNNQNLHDLDGLSALITAGGLSIRSNSNLVDIDGLSALQSTDWVDIGSNPKLTNVDGFTSLNHIEKYVSIQDNSSIQSINGFNGVVTIPESVVISMNTGLMHIGGFQSLTSIGSIKVSSNTKLEDVTGLSHLTRINIGEFNFFYNPMMTTLDVSSLRFVKGDIILNSMGGLPNVDSFSAVDSIGGRIEVFDCASIQNIDGFSNIKAVGASMEAGMKSVIIRDNPRLKSITGLRSITKIPTTIEFLANDSIASLDGLRSLKEIGNDLHLVGFKVLTNVNGLQNLTKVGGELTINNNTLLTNLDSLSSLTQIGHSLWVSNNESLTQIDGLRNITSMTGSDKQLAVNINPALTRCCGIYNLLTDPNVNVVIDNNGAGCTKEDILANGPCEGSSPQTCDSNIGLHSQADVNAFPSTYGCPVVGGTLTIYGNDITNLDSLSILTEVRGSLRIGVIPPTGNPQLTNINGLSSLTKVGDTLWIDSNPQLTTLSGLNNLSSFKNLHIINNAGLQSIDDLTVPDSISTAVIAINHSLTSIQAFHNVTYVSGSLTVTQCDALTSLEGLNGLIRVGNEANPYTYLNISSLHEITNVDQLSGLLEVIGVRVSVIITNNDNLTNIDGLSSLGYIRSTDWAELNIIGNPALTNINGLSSLTSMSGAQAVFIMRNNTSLATCCGVARLLRDGMHCNGENCTTIDISGNAAGCTKEDILAGGACCPSGGTMPLDKVVTPEQAWGYAPHSTNIIVQNYEPGIMYELRKVSDNSPVAGPWLGNVGLYVSNVTETTEYKVLATNPQSGCESEMSMHPVVKIIQPASECTSNPDDKQLWVEYENVPPGSGTNIVVLAGQEGVSYVLRKDSDDSWVSGPYPSSAGLYSGSLNTTTTFNVLAIDDETYCSAEMTQRVTVTIDPNSGGRMMSDASVDLADAFGEKHPFVLYPNPNRGEFTVEITNNISGPHHLIVYDMLSKVVKQQVLIKDTQTLTTSVDLRPASKGMYLMVIRNSEGTTLQKKIAVVD